MLAEEAMTIDERRKYLRQMARRYIAGDRVARGALLMEMETVTGMHRKSLIRLLGSETLERRPRAKQRGRTYGEDVRRVVRVVWESLDYICAERLAPTLLETARHLAGFDELTLTPDLEGQLAAISEATVQRMIRGLPRWDRPRLPRKGPVEANRLRRAVPMTRIPWDTTVPGHFEVDLVHHSGAAAEGDYGYTFQMVDVATGWSERVALLGRGQRAMVAAFDKAASRLPFPILELHPDNGSEFFNNHLVRHWGQTITGLTLTRSRPYHKNDNRFVEQKNDSLVRAYLGNERFDTPEQIAALNTLYDQMWLFYNFFQPVQRLSEKTFIDGKTHRRWDSATTPYQRVRTTGVLVPDQQIRLDDLHAKTNPRALRRLIYDQLAALAASLPRPADHPAAKQEIA
ncbi:MAG TPA: hypothetical protein VIY56_18575 [Vicinamibacterales bacterium]